MKNWLSLLVLLLFFCLFCLEAKRKKANFISTSSESSNELYIICEDGKYIVNQGVLGYLSILYITNGYLYNRTNFTNAYVSLLNKDKWCILNETSEDGGYNSFLWNDVTNPIQLEHLAIGDNDWFVDGNYFNSNYTENFKWNITLESNGFQTIRLHNNTNYTLASSPRGELFLTTYNSSDAFQLWKFKI